MSRKPLCLAVLFAAACGGGIKHTKVMQPASEDVNAQELAKIGSLTSIRENGGALFVGGSRGLAAVDEGGKVLWTLALPEVTARLVEADADGVVWASFNYDGTVEGGVVAGFLFGSLGDEPHFKDQTIGAATRDGKLLFTAPAKTGITQMSPPGISKDQIGISRGRSFWLYSRADGHEINGAVLLGEGGLSDIMVLNGSFNRPTFVNGSWYVAHMGDFMKVDQKGVEQDRTRLWGLLTPLANITIGPLPLKDRMIIGTCPIDDKKPGVFAFDKDGGKDWKEFIDDKVSGGFMRTVTSGVGAITSNSKFIFVATNFHVVAMTAKGSTEWEKANKGGGLYPSKYRGLRFTRNYGARRSQGQLIAADEKNVYVATKYKEFDALTVLDANSGEYQGSLDLGTHVIDMAFLGGKIALATEGGLKLVTPL